MLTILRRLLHTGAHTAEDGGSAEKPEKLDDRSELLRELEVSVPAPERIVGWDAARGSQRFSRT